jgi:ADP-ribose pyrophosphatase YjhB (NUDIX family)
MWVVEETSMRREYPKVPIVAVGVIICSSQPAGEKRILLIRRDKEPARGLWTFPGGAVELGESVRAAARREAREETGLEVEVGDVAVVIDHVAQDAAGHVQYHYIIIDFYANPIGGALQPGTDVSDARWASLADLDELQMTEKAEEITRQLLGDAATPRTGSPSPIL